MMENFMKACSLADKKKNGKKVRFIPNRFVFCGQCFVWVACGLVLLLVVFVNSRKRVVPMRLT